MPGAIGLGQQAMDFLQREGRTVADQGPTPDMLQDATRHQRASINHNIGSGKSFRSFQGQQLGIPRAGAYKQHFMGWLVRKVSGSDASSEGPLSRALR